MRKKICDQIERFVTGLSFKVVGRQFPFTRAMENGLEKYNKFDVSLEKNCEMRRIIFTHLYLKISIVLSIPT